MSSGDSRINDLIRVIGAERDSQPPELVAFAEREVIRRLGGTREQARKRLKAGGMVSLGLGLLTLGVALALARYYPEGLPIGSRIGGTVVIGLVGLAEAVVGVAALVKARWVMRAGWLIPFFRSPGAAALAAKPPVDDLLQTIGPDRQAGSAESIAQAEHDLRERLDLAGSQMSKRVRAWAMQCMLGGSFSAFLSAGCLVGVFIRSFVWPFSGNPPEGLEIVFDIAFMVVFGTLMVASIIWIAAGRGLRRRSPWAPRALIISFSAFIVGTALILVPQMFYMVMSFPNGWSVVALVMVLGPIALLPAFLVRGMQTIALPEVREACGLHVGSLKETASSLTPEGRLRSPAWARWLVIATVSLIVLLAVEAYTAAVLGRRASRPAEVEKVFQ